MKLENIFDIQSDVALNVASEIQAVLTKEEKESIRKIPTRNFAAVNLFLQAKDVHNIAEAENKWELDRKAENLYRRAIQLDSAYADPYASLGWIVSERDIDSAMYLADQALRYDPENPEAYNLKGFVYGAKGMEKESEESYKLSIKYKPNNSAAFRGLGDLYFFKGNCSRAIENQLVAFHQENNSTQERKNVESFASDLYCLGFYDEGAKYAARLLDLNNDSTYYFWGLVTADLDRGNYESALKSARKMFSLDPDNPENIYRLFYTNLYLRDFREAGLLMEKYIGIMKRQGKKIEPDYLLGFAYFENGQKAEADFHFDGVITEMKKIITLNQSSVNCRVYLTLVKIYSARNDRVHAIEYLHKVRECIGSTVLRVKDFKNCTMLDNIRKEPEFALYLRDAEQRYRDEHDKVAEILLREGILVASSK
jgi:tetratricopeptide (TPR) repeat protein